MMDKSQGHLFKGKSLNEIEINPELDFAEYDDIEPPLVESGSSSQVIDMMAIPSTSNNTNECKKTKSKYLWSSRKQDLSTGKFSDEV